MTAVLGIDIGGTKAGACVLGGDGSIGPVVRSPTGAGFGPEQLLELVDASLRRVPAPGRVGTVGLGFPGLVDAAAGTVRSSVILPHWRGAEPCRLVTERFGIPCVLDNDVHNSARAELRARPGVTDFLFVSVGTGIGGAIVMDGAIRPGVGGLAGEIGHTTVVRDGPVCDCGRRGCIGTLASGRALEQRLGLGAGTLAEAVRTASPATLEALNDAADLLGVAIANAVHLVNPGCVVLGGGLAEIERFVERVRAAVIRETFPEFSQGLVIEAARAGYDAGAVGAALLAGAWQGQRD